MAAGPANYWLLDDDIALEITGIRHNLHRFPELSHRESQTQATLIRSLEKAGITTYSKVLDTGLVVDIIGQMPEKGPNVGFRGELDALPIHEDRPDLDYRSEIPGVMHACGHDTHTSIALAVALQLNRYRAHYSGLARIWFQPGEESEPLGGRAFRDLGLMNGIDCAVGVHAHPGLPSGKIGVLPGVVNCSADEWRMTVLGKSSHGGIPHEGRDAITIAASIIQEFNQFVSRRTDPDTPLVITVGKLHGGSATNIVCDRVEMAGTIRSMDEAIRAETHQFLRALAATFEQLHGINIELRIQSGEPCTINDPLMVRTVIEAVTDISGAESIADCKRWTASDDFGFYSDEMPSVYYWYGCRNPDRGNIHGLHHPKFGADDADMIMAARVGIAVMGRLLKSA